MPIDAWTSKEPTPDFQPDFACKYSYFGSHMICAKLMGIRARLRICLLQIPSQRSGSPRARSDCSADCDFLIDIGFGKNCPQETRDFWRKEIQANYQGDDGRKRARMAAINLRDRDGLHGRLFDVRCPVMWLHVSLSERPSHWLAMTYLNVVACDRFHRR